MSRWRVLAPEQRQAAGAAAALLLVMFLPWYQTTTTAFLPGRGESITAKNSLSAFEAFTWIEAAVLLVAAGVLYLLWARSERKGFHLPGGDGWAITAGGTWVILLLVWRLFDKPQVEGSAVGIAWGIFVAMAVAAALVAAGQRVRAAHRPEPPNPAAEEGEWEQPRRARRSEQRAPADPGAVTEVLRDRPPAWEGEPPEPPGRAGPVEPRPPEPPGRAGPVEPRPPGPPAPPDRLF